MSLGRTRTSRAVAVAALLAGALVLVGLTAIGHTHDDGSGGVGHCELCRFAHHTAPSLATALLLVFTLPESGWTHLAVRVLQPQSSRRRLRSRGPPLS